MSVKVVTLASKGEEFKKRLLNHHYEVSKAIAAKLEKNGKQLLELTLQDANTGFGDAKVKVTKKVEIKRDGCIVKMHFLVVDSGGRPHKVWHIVNRGRKTGILKKNIVFNPRTNPRNRTFPGKVTTKPWSGAKAGKQFMSKGTKLEGFEGREFYKTVLDLLVKTFDRAKWSRNYTITKKKFLNGRYIK
jgi:hypothetical protein